MKFLVTGGAGFIGSHVVDRLVAAGCEVRVVDNMSMGRQENVHCRALFTGPHDVATVPDDWLDEQTVAIHLAARPRCTLSVYAPTDDVLSNYVPGVSFLTRCIQRRVRRFVLLSSIAVYGNPGRLPYTEDMEPHPRDPYSINKHALERLCLIECRRNDIEVVVLRAQHVFGPRQRADLRYRNVIARWIRRALHHQSLPVYGSLDLRRAFSPVSLVCRGIVRAAMQDGIDGEVFNLGSGVVRSLRSISEQISSLLGIDITHEFLTPPPGLLAESYGAVQKAQRRLGVVEDRNEFDDNLRALIEELLDPPSAVEFGIVPELRRDEYASIFGTAQPEHAASLTI
jgi:UDP-glucose 4-epimerase